jgi:hypothetical protein
MWTQKERKAYNDAKEKKIQDLKDARYKKRAIADKAPEVSDSMLTPGQRDLLHSILEVSVINGDIHFIKSILRFKRITKSQKAMLNKIYLRSKDLLTT